VLVFVRIWMMDWGNSKKVKKAKNQNEELDV